MASRMHRVVGPSASVVMLAGDDADRLAITLQTLLAQSLRQIEVLVVDDGGVGVAATVADELDDDRVRVLINPVPLGLARSVTRGLRQAQAALVALAQPGDRCEPSRLERQFDAMESRPDLSVLGTWHTLIDGQGRVLGHREPAHESTTLAWDLCWGDTLRLGTVMLRRRAVLDAGGFDPVCDACCPYEMWTRLIMRGHRLSLLPEYLTHVSLDGLDKAGDDAAMPGLMARYQGWVRREFGDWGQTLAPARRLLHEGLMARADDRVFRSLAPVHRTLRAWYRRLPAQARPTLRRHVSELLLGRAVDHMTRQRGAAAALLARAAMVRPAILLQRRTWRVASGLCRARPGNDAMSAPARWRSPTPEHDSQTPIAGFTLDE